MTLEEATDRAVGKALRIKRYVYVICEDGRYDVVTDSELDCYWRIAEVVLTVTPTGEKHERKTDFLC